MSILANDLERQAMSGGQAVAAPAPPALTHRERELGAIIDAYNAVTEQLKQSHEKLGGEVVRLREELAGKNRQLQRRERLAALGELAAGMAHEIRNPLAGIRLFACLLERDLHDRPAQAQVVRKIIKGVSTLEALVTDILEFGRPRAPVPGIVVLDHLVREAIELARGRDETKQVEVRVSPDPVDIKLVTDGVLLQRALLNLLINAFDAARNGSVAPHVCVQVTTANSQEVVLTVSDNGPGIPGDLLDRIFDPFFTTKDTGTGLGLAIVHQIAESLGGSVQAANRPEGGAMFSLRLPKDGRGGSAEY